MTKMSYIYMHMSDTKSLGVGHNVRHVKNFFRNTGQIIEHEISTFSVPGRKMNLLVYFPAETNMFTALNFTSLPAGEKVELDLLSQQNTNYGEGVDFTRGPSARAASPHPPSSTRLIFFVAAPLPLFFFEEPRLEVKQ